MEEDSPAHPGGAHGGQERRSPAGGDVLGRSNGGRDVVWERRRRNRKEEEVLQQEEEEEEEEEMEEERPAKQEGRRVALPSRLEVKRSVQRRRGATAVGGLRGASPMAPWRCG